MSIAILVVGSSVKWMVLWYWDISPTTPPAFSATVEQSMPSVMNSQYTNFIAFLEPTSSTVFVLYSPMNYHALRSGASSLSSAWLHDSRTVDDPSTQAEVGL